LRCGAIARFSPIMRAVVDDARSGKLVIGICNGFQILCEAGLLPGALMRNRSLHFVCDMVTTRVEVANTPFTREMKVGTRLRMPVAHGDGCYYADGATLRELNERQQILLRYCDAEGNLAAGANPNGSLENIAGICNHAGNVFGLMPHPDRACEERLGSSDGARIFESMLEALAADRVAA
jgi:phosphoribosylformylglycinamidine synthase